MTRLLPLMEEHAFNLTGIFQDEFGDQFTDAFWELNCLIDAKVGYKQILGS